MKTKTPSPIETLRRLSVTKKNGVRAVHRWATGFQVLVFPTLSAFNHAKAHIEKPTAD